jgi:hypothetical protein
LGSKLLAALHKKPESVDIKVDTPKASLSSSEGNVQIEVDPVEEVKTSSLPTPLLQLPSVPTGATMSASTRGPPLLSADKVAPPGLTVGQRAERVELPAPPVVFGGPPGFGQSGFPMKEQMPMLPNPPTLTPWGQPMNEHFVDPFAQMVSRNLMASMPFDHNQMMWNRAPSGFLHDGTQMFPAQMQMVSPLGQYMQPANMQQPIYGRNVNMGQGYSEPETRPFDVNLTAVAAGVKRMEVGHPTFSPSLPTEKNKSNALLSIMKSKAGGGLVMNHQNSNTDLLSTNSGVAVPSTDEVSAVNTKKLIFRITKNQIGELRMTVRNFKTNNQMIIQDSYFMRPGNSLNVQWRLPATWTLPQNSKIVIGLLRLGSQTNLQSIIAKTIMFDKAQIGVDSVTGERYLHGAIAFFAPRSAGQFVFRLYDETSRESSMKTLATSVSFSVVLMENDVADSLKHVLEAWAEDNSFKAIASFGQIIKGMKSIKENKELTSTFNHCLDTLIDAVNKGMAVLDANDVKNSLPKPDVNLDKKDAVSNPEEEEFFKNVQTSRRLQVDAYETLAALVEHKTPWYLATEKLKATVIYMNSLFCPILRRYFSSYQELASSRFKAFGFYPALYDAKVSSFVEIDKAVICKLPDLLPKNTFFVDRDAIRKRFESILINVEDIPRDARLELFGSSANNFGNDQSDLDMCLLFPDHVVLTIDDKARIMEQIGTLLGDLGMTKINIRATARVPIVEFFDESSGLDCDICLQNSLALTNSRLLYQYSLLDPRVRPLAYVVKYWAKCREINSPSNGTLSSYGYVLSVLHFLQV